MTRTITTILAAALTLGALTACVPQDETGTAVPTTTPWSYTRPKFAAPTTTIPVKTDPYRTTGTWLVPSEIAPGNYRVTVQPGQTRGYTATCSTLTCDIGGGLMDNANYSGPGILVIHANAVSVELKRVILTPLVGA